MNDETEDHNNDCVVHYGLPLHLIKSLQGYVEQFIPTGGFLRACLENDLKEACGRADSQNRYLIFDIVRFMYNELPLNCWGSREVVAQWIASKGESYQESNEPLGAEHGKSN